MYQPSSEALKKIRQEIDYNAAELITVLNAPRFKQLLGALPGEKLKKRRKAMMQRTHRLSC